MSTRSGWNKTRKSFYFLLGALTLATALTACDRGFKSKQPAKVRGAGARNISIQTTYLNKNPLLEMAATASSEVAAMVQNPANLNRLQVSSNIGFAMTLDANGLSVPDASVLYLSINVQAADGKQATAMVVSNKAALEMTATEGLMINGYWTIDRPGKTYPFYIGLNSAMILNGNGTANLKGTVFANFTGTNYETLASFDESICTLVVDPQVWSTRYYSETDFAGCALPEASPEYGDDMGI